MALAQVPAGKSVPDTSASALWAKQITGQQLEDVGTRGWTGPALAAVVLGDLLASSLPSRPLFISLWAPGLPLDPAWVPGIHLQPSFPAQVVLLQCPDSQPERLLCRRRCSAISPKSAGKLLPEQWTLLPRKPQVVLGALWGVAATAGSLFSSHSGRLPMWLQDPAARLHTETGNDPKLHPRRPRQSPDAAGISEFQPRKQSEKIWELQNPPWRAPQLPAGWLACPPPREAVLIPTIDGI